MSIISIPRSQWLHFVKTFSSEWKVLTFGLKILSLSLFWPFGQLHIPCFSLLFSFYTSAFSLYTTGLNFIVYIFQRFGLLKFGLFWGPHSFQPTGFFDLRTEDGFFASLLIMVSVHIWIYKFYHFLLISVLLFFAFKCCIGSVLLQNTIFLQCC